jgi:hypothetical protein
MSHTYLAVTRERGPAWERAKPMERQQGWAAHAAFMSGLADEGFVVLGGPLGKGETILLIVEAEDTEVVHARLAADPWSPELLQIKSIEPWQIRLGGSAARH